MIDTRIRSVRHELLALHKQLIDAERVEYEREHGRVAPTEMLRLLVEDARFAWLGALTTLIARADEWLETDERTDADGTAWLDEVRALLVPDPAAGRFHERYATALQDRPEVILAHGAVMRAVRP